MEVKITEEKLGAEDGGVYYGVVFTVGTQMFGGGHTLEQAKAGVIESIENTDFLKETFERLYKETREQQLLLEKSLKTEQEGGFENMRKHCYDHVVAKYTKRTHGTYLVRKCLTEGETPGKDGAEIKILFEVGRFERVRPSRGFVLGYSKKGGAELFIRKVEKDIVTCVMIKNANYEFFPLEALEERCELYALGYPSKEALSFPEYIKAQADLKVYLKYREELEEGTCVSFDNFKIPV